MSDDHRFDGQDPEDDEVSASFGGYDEASMQQDQGGRAPGRDLMYHYTYGRGSGYSYGRDEFSSGLRGQEEEPPDDRVEDAR